MSEERGVSVGKIVGAAISVLILLTIVFGSFRIVGVGERGVLLNFNAVQDVIYNEGFHWKIPIYQKIIKMDVTIQKKEKGNVDGASFDLQQVTTDVAVNYHLDVDYVNIIYQTLKKDYVNRVVSPTIEEAVKKTTAEFTAEELITKRAEVKASLVNNITTTLALSNIIVDNVFITDFQFSETFDAAIEAKVIAEQKAFEAENKLKQVEFEAAQRLAQATAEAEAIKIQAQAITQQGGAEYVRLKWVEAWAAGGAKVPQYVMGEGGQAFLFNMPR